MATLASTELNITLNLPAKTARVVVTGKIQFSQWERFLMQHGWRCKLNCTVWGEDNGQGNWLDADDCLFSYNSKFYPDATPSVLESFIFDTIVPISLINEDAGTDEIYAELTFVDGFNNITKKRTNVIVQQLA